MLKEQRILRYLLASGKARKTWKGEAQPKISAGFCKPECFRVTISGFCSPFALLLRLLEAAVAGASHIQPGRRMLQPFGCPSRLARSCFKAYGRAANHSTLCLGRKTLT